MRPSRTIAICGNSSTYMLYGSEIPRLVHAPAANPRSAEHRRQRCRSPLGHSPTPCFLVLFYCPTRAFYPLPFTSLSTLLHKHHLAGRMLTFAVIQESTYA